MAVKLGELEAGQTRIVHYGLIQREKHAGDHQIKLKRENKKEHREVKGSKVVRKTWSHK